MKQEFMNFLNALMEQNPELTKNLMTDNVRLYIEAISGDQVVDKSEPTEKGKQILKYLQENVGTRLWKSKDIADGMGVASRSVSGCMKKLADDGYLERLGKDPVVYTLTEKGKNYIIVEEEENN